VGQICHNFGWVTWVMGHSMMTRDPLPFTAYVFNLHFMDLHKLAERPHIHIYIYLRIRQHIRKVKI